MFSTGHGRQKQRQSNCLWNSKYGNWLRCIRSAEWVERCRDTDLAKVSSGGLTVVVVQLLWS